MKRNRTGKILLCGFLFIIARTCFADPGEIEQLRRVKHFLEQEYQKYVEETYSKIIVGRLARRLEDFSKAVLFSAKHLDQLEVDYEKAESIGRLAFEKIKGDISSIHQEDLYLAALGASLSKIRNALLVTENDLEDLLQGWEQRCNNDEVERLVSIYDPESLFPVWRMGDSLPIRERQGELGLGLGYPAPLDELRPTANPFFSLTFNLSSALGSYIAGPIAGTIAPIVPFAVTIVLSALDFQKSREYENLTHDITSLQDAAHKYQKSRARSLIAKFCDRVMPNMLNQAFQENIGRARNLVVKAENENGEHQKRLDNLRKEYSDFLEVLDRDYFPRVESDFLSVIRNYYDTESQNAANATAFLLNELKPVCSEFSLLRAFDPRVLLEKKHLIADLLIQGDVRFTTDPDFKFGNHLRRHTLETSVWNQISENVIAQYLGGLGAQ